MIYVIVIFGFYFWIFVKIKLIYKRDWGEGVECYKRFWIIYILVEGVNNIVKFDLKRNCMF